MISLDVLRARLPALLYWLLPLLLGGLQLAYSLNSLTHIRGEELAESVRNVYWLDQGTIYDSISSNVGYYGSLLALYKTFGFWIHGAKLFRAALHLAALYALAFVLLRWFRPRHAWLPLAVIGLSPTMLYFNTMQTSYGIDMPYFLLCLLLIALGPFEGGRVRGALLAFGLGCLAMVAAMSYPTFLLYIPALGLLVLLAWRRSAASPGALLAHTTLAGLGFLLPLVGALLYVKDPGLLIYDPRYEAGIFRGGGVLMFQARDFTLNVLRVVADLVHSGNSYYFTPARVEFSSVFVQLPVLAISIAAVVLFKRQRALRPLLLIAGLLFLLHLVLPQWTAFRTPGIRRATGVLVAFYAAYCVVWFALASRPNLKPWLRRVGFVVCLAPLAHHLLVFPFNYAAIARPDRWSNRDWFALKATPHASLLAWEGRTAAGEALACRDLRGELWPRACRYAEIFGAIQGHRVWNGLEKRPVRAYDWKTGKMIPLKLALYETHYFPH